MTIESPIQTDGGNAANNGATVSSTTIAEMKDGNGQSMDAEVSSPVVVALKRKQDAATPIVEVCSAEASGVDSAVAVAAESAQAHVEKESAAKKLKLDDESTKEAEATTASSSSAEPSKELEMARPGQEAANQAETEAEDDESIYPDTEEFYAWMVTGGESGAFLASHRVSTVDTAIPAAQKLVELNITNIIPTEDQEHCEKDEKEGDANGEDETVEDLKDLTNACIEDAYAISGPFMGKSDSPDDETVTESEGNKALRATIQQAQSEKKWLRIKVARDADNGIGLPITMADFEARQGLIIPKIGFWRFIVEAALANADIETHIKSLMERFL